jgi:hypothetical protein
MNHANGVRTSSRSTPMEQHSSVGLGDGEHPAHVLARPSFRPLTTLRPGIADLVTIDDPRGKSARAVASNPASDGRAPGIIRIEAARRDGRMAWTRCSRLGRACTNWGRSEGVVQPMRALARLGRTRLFATVLATALAYLRSSGRRGLRLRRSRRLRPVG